MSLTGQRSEGFPFNPSSSVPLFLFRRFCSIGWKDRMEVEDVWVSNLDHLLSCASLTHLQLVPRHWKVETFSLAWDRRLTQQEKERDVYSDSQGSPAPPAGVHTMAVLCSAPVPPEGKGLNHCWETCQEAWIRRRDILFLVPHVLFACSSQHSLKPLLIKLPSCFFYSQSSEKAPNEHLQTQNFA